MFSTNNCSFVIWNLTAINILLENNGIVQNIFDLYIILHILTDVLKTVKSHSFRSLQRCKKQQFLYNYYYYLHNLFWSLTDLAFSALDYTIYLHQIWLNEKNLLYHFMFFGIECVGTKLLRICNRISYPFSLCSWNHLFSFGISNAVKT